MDQDNIERSDFLMYNKIIELQFKDKKQNDLSFIYQMSSPAPRCMIDRGDELKFFKEIYKNKIPFCNQCTADRGGNHPGCEIQRSCPKPEYSRYYMNEFLLTPCPKPTYKNYVVCDQTECGKCCSKRHQLFNNVTKRKDITPWK